MRDLRGNLITISINENKEKRFLLVFKIPKSKFQLQYVTDKNYKVNTENDIILGKPILVEEIKRKVFLNCGECKLGNFSGSRFSLMHEPKLFVFSSNILVGSWKIFTDERNKKIYLLRMS